MADAGVVGERGVQDEALDGRGGCWRGGWMQTVVLRKREE